MQPLYQIDGLWHRSTNGLLYFGRRIADGKLVIIKTPPNNPTLEAIRRFQDEIRVLSRSYAGLVRVEYWYSGADGPYYVMDRMAATLLDYCGRATRSQIYVVANAIGQALTSVHAGLDLHGDVKPANILVNNGRVYLSDPIGAPGVPRSWLQPSRGGTPGYMAPELRAGLPISRASDVYSYGATLYHLITGIVPVDGQRLDAAIQEYEIDSVMRGVVYRCCQPIAAARPSIEEAGRLLSGATWEQVEDARRISLTLATLGAAAVAITIGCALGNSRAA